MGILVRLEDVIDALDMPEEWEVFLDPETGEITAVTEDDRFYLDDEDEALDRDDLPEWQQQSLERARRAVESESMLRLPDRFEVHEWDIMLQFARAQDEPVSTELQNAIHGRGAFRMFRSTTHRLGIRDEWYAFRAEALKGIAIEWLQSHGIAFVEGSPQEGRENP